MLRRPRARAPRGLLIAATAASLWAITGCGHSARTLKLRTALDSGDPKGAIEAANDELDVKSGKELPADLAGDNALIVLDRASIQQSIAQWKDSARDLEAADKAIDMLDLARNAGDSIGEYVFSGSSGRYVAPPYEKLLINTLDMINYLELGDLNGARIEARRLSVMQKYIKDELKDPDNPILGLGGFLAGYAFEKSGNADEALHYYDDALKFSGFRSIKDPARALMTKSAYKTQRLTALGTEAAPLPPPLEDSGEAELVVVVGYGRVPHKVSNRIPIGLALTLFARDIHPTDAQAANKLATQGLVTWINYPTLAAGQGSYETPRAAVDSSYLQLEEAVDVSAQVRSEWHKIEGKIVASAITRLIARLAVGEGIQMAAGKDSIAGFIASLGAQATLAALDTPDTRSWETLPARVALTRVRVPAGKHTIRLEARGVSRSMSIDLPKGGWKVVSLMALR
jgi:uncharacterized protein